MNTKVVRAIEEAGLKYEFDDNKTLIIKQYSYNCRYLNFVCPFCRTSYKTNNEPYKHSHNKVHVVENPNLIPKIVRKQKQKDYQTADSPETVQPIVVPTPVKVLFRSTPSSPDSSPPSPNSSTTPLSHIPTTSTTPSSPVVPVIPLALGVPLIPIIMARYAPLQLPTNPRTMPPYYQSKITYFDATTSCTALQHTKKMQDYFESYEIDDDSVRMKIFFQSLTGDVTTWFRALPPNSILNPEALYQTFINRWEKRKDPLHILSEYESIKRGPGEAVLDYCARFNNVYNAIPPNLRPPPDLALYKFPDGFDAEMAYQLRERAPQSLAEMQDAAVSVEANLIAKRNRTRFERKTTFKEEPSSFE